QDGGDRLFGGFRGRVGVLLPGAAPSDESDPARSCQLPDPVGAHRFDERLDLLLLPGDLDHDLVGTHVHDPASKDLDQALNLDATLPRNVNFDEHQVTFDVILERDVEDIDDRDDLLQLLADLLDVPVVSHDHDGDT